MPAADSCPACRRPLTATSAAVFMPVEDMSVAVCASCTCVVIGPPYGRVEDSYRARVWGGATRAEFLEHDDGSIRPAATAVLAEQTAGKLRALRGALRRGDILSASVLEVGCRNGAFASAACERFRGLQLAALEPWLPWRDEATQRGLNVVAGTAETLEGGGADIVVEFDLLDRFPDPVSHLQALSRLMKPRGHLVLCVSNIANCAGMLHTHRLRRDAPVGFTRCSLKAACATAGLRASIWEDGPTLYAICGRGEEAFEAAPPTDAARLVRRFQETDGRLLLKRALAKHGLTEATLRVAQAAAAACRTPDVHAALCRDVAHAARRVGLCDLAARWYALPDNEQASENVA